MDNNEMDEGGPSNEELNNYLMSNTVHSSRLDMIDHVFIPLIMNTLDIPEESSKVFTDVARLNAKVQEEREQYFMETLDLIKEQQREILETLGKHV